MALAGFGIFELVKGGSALTTAAASAKWPETRGHITKSTIESFGQDEGGHDEPAILYSYTVEGRSYTASGISPGLGVSLDLAWMIISRYPEGSSHKVYYLPSDPATAYLEPGIQPCSFLNLLLGSVLFLFGASTPAASYFIPKYGKRRANGTFTLPSSHPLSKALTLAILLMGIQFAALMYLCYQGYVVNVLK